jgi:hypothetical protein
MSKPDEFHAHEALHTTYVLTETFADHVVDSAFVQSHPHLLKMAENAVSVLHNLYQAIGNEADK